MRGSPRAVGDTPSSVGASWDGSQIVREHECPRDSDTIGRAREHCAQLAEAWADPGLIRAVRLPGSGYRRFGIEDVERMREEMLSQLAPADTGPSVEPRRPVKGRIVHGDDV